MPKHLSAQEKNTFVTHAQEVASFYGFAPLPDTVKAEKSKLRKNVLLPKVPTFKSPKDRPSFYATDRFRVLKSFIDVGVINSPTPLFVHHGTEQRGKKAPTYFGLDIIHTPKSIAEAIIIQTAKTILTEAGHRDMYVEINSLGDQESKQVFMRECVAYYRKHIQDLPDECKDALRRNVFDVLRCTKHEACRHLQEEAPKPLNFLSDDSRNHFQEVLEYLENMEIPYRINTTLIGTDECHTKTVFEIYAGTMGDEIEGSDPNNLLATGGRYDELPRKIGFRRNLPAIGTSLYLDTPCALCRVKQRKKKKGPQVFLIQIGFSAKLLSLRVIDMLRRDQIEIHQSLSRDRLGSQLKEAETKAIPFTLIIGQKEALDHTVIVRDMNSRSQESIPVEKLSQYLCSMRK